MKLQFIIGAVTLAVGFNGPNGLAKGNGDTESAAPVVHHSATSTTAPQLAPVPSSHPGGAGYRPLVNVQNGNRVLLYPAVGVSTQRHQMESNVSNLNSGYALQRAAASPHHLSRLSSTAKTTLDPQTSSRLRHWNGSVDSPARARINHAEHCQHHHDRDWWRHHCVTLIFFDFGWWGWWDGWWYPAWGYDPYSYYDYNEPIYGYGGLSPEQIIVNVQVALQQRGYHEYAIDGRMGQLTRAAIARYQVDHRLPITYEIDPATLGALGIIR